MDDPSFVLKENYSLYLVCLCIPCSPLFCMLQNEVWVEITEDEYVRCGAMFDRLEWRWVRMIHSFKNWWDQKRKERNSSILLT